MFFGNWGNGLWIIVIIIILLGFTGNYGCNNSCGCNSGCGC